MRRLQVLIVDDEELARLRLRSLLADCALPGAEVVGEAGSAAEALHKLSAAPVDLVLLDIQMPGLGGLQLAERMRSLASPPKVVFVTAHAEHALKAFEIDAVDYLTKPVRRARLQEALVRVAQRLDRVAPAAPAKPAAPAEQPVLVVSDRGRVQRVPVADILYLKAELKYVTLRTPAHAYVLDDSLSDLEQRLGDVMLRIHRNALVARTAVTKLDLHGPAFGVAVAGAIAGRAPLQLRDGRARHERVAMDAQHDVAQALLQIRQRVVQHVRMRRGAQGDVLELRLQVQDVGDRDALHAPAIADDQHRLFGSRGRPGRRRAVGQQAAHAQARQLLVVDDQHLQARHGQGLRVIVGRVTAARPGARGSGRRRSGRPGIRNGSRASGAGARARRPGRCRGPPGRRCPRC